MKWTALPLAWKLALVPATMALLLVAVMLLLTDRLLGDYLDRRAGDRVERQAQAFADRVGRALDRRSGELQLLSRSAALQDGTPRMRESLEWLQQQTPGYAWLGVTDLDGVVRAGSGGLLEGVSIAQRPVFREARQGPWLGDVHAAVALAPLLAAHGEPVPDLIDIGVPVLDAAGRPRGVLAAHVNWQWFEQLRERTLIADGADGPALLLLSRQGALRLGQLPASGLSALTAALARAEPSAAALRYEQDGRPQLAAQAAVASPDGTPRLGWSVVAVQDLALARAPVTALMRSVAIGGLLLAASFGVIGYLWSSRLSRPYAGLLDAAIERFSQQGGRPAGGLTAYLDTLSEQVRRLGPDRPAPGTATGESLLGQLLHDAQRLRTVLDQLPAAVYLSDAQDRLTYYNQAAARMFGWTAEVMGRPVGPLLLGDTVSPRQVQLHARLQVEPGPFDFQGSVQRPDGSRVRGEWRLTKMHGANGDYLGLLAQARDATAEHEARERASALQDWLQILTEAAVDYAFVVLDANGHVRSFNSGAERLKGYRADEILGEDYAVFFTPEDRNAGIPQRLREQAQQDGQVEFEGWRVRRDGSRFWGNVLLYRLGKAEAAAGYAEVARDLSARRDAETRLRENEATLSAVIQSASDAVISIDVEGRILLFNPAAERIFGHDAAALMGQPLERLLPATHRAHHGGDLARFAASRVSRRSMGAGQVQGVHADGRLIELEASISQVVVHERQVLTAILRDVTERVAAERALTRYQKELAALTQLLMNQEKLTARRVAQALHDQLGQTLAAIRLGLDASPPQDPAQHRRLDRLVEQAIAEVRQVLIDLRPPLLDELGLAAALDNEIAARHPLPTGIELLLDVPPALAAQRWPADIEYAAFMIAREAIGNALRHAGASLVRVSLLGDAAALQLEVTDDGSGLSEAATQGLPGHLGMVGMRERAVAIGAQFEVASAPGDGSQVTLSWKDTTR